MINQETRKKQLERTILAYEKEYGACQEILEFHRMEDWTKVPLYNVTAYHGPN